ncbi:hypothetical protein LguiA_034335 [Lonicera macranthoides]
MWFFKRKRESECGFSSSSTAEEVTHGIDGNFLTAIVTGASSGIGIETARVLALRGVQVVMAVRNMDGGKKVKENIIEEIPDAKIDVMELDLSSMESIRKFALEFNSSGVMVPDFRLSKDKIELHFATNYLGHFLLTNLLLETMKSTTSKTQIEGRIINVSSEGHLFVYREGIQFDKINEDTRFKYGQSKLASIMHANELARRLKEEGVKITVNSLHTGSIATNLLRHRSFLDGIVNVIGKYVFKTVQQGAATTCYVALHPQVEGVSGEYFSDCNIAKASALAGDTKMAKRLWNFSLNLIASNSNYL